MPSLLASRHSLLKIILLFLAVFGAQFFLPTILNVAHAQNNTIQAAPCPPVDDKGNIVELPDIKKICTGYQCYDAAKAGNSDASRCWTDYGIFSGDPKVSPVSPNCLACGSCDICDLASGVSGLVYWIMLLIGVTVLAVVIWGGAQYLFSGGNPAKAKKGADILKYAGLGIVIILFAYTLVAYLLYALTGGANNPGQTNATVGFLNSWLSPCASRKDRFSGVNAADLKHIYTIDDNISCFKYLRINAVDNTQQGEIYKFCPPPSLNGNGGCGFTVNMFDQKATYKDSTGTEFQSTGKPPEQPATPPTTK